MNVVRNLVVICGFFQELHNGSVDRVHAQVAIHGGTAVVADPDPSLHSAAAVVHTHPLPFCRHCRTPAF